MKGGVIVEILIIALITIVPFGFFAALIDYNMTIGEARK